MLAKATARGFARNMTAKPITDPTTCQIGHGTAQVTQLPAMIPRSTIRSVRE
jgi:hypothetical protein